MLQNASVVAFTVSELWRENQQREGGGVKITPPTQIRVKKCGSFLKYVVLVSKTVADIFNK